MHVLARSSRPHVLLTLCLLLGVTGCGDKEGTSTDPTGSTSAADTTGGVTTGSVTTGTADASTSGTTGEDTSTSVTTGAGDATSTTENEPPDPCNSSCGSEELCFVDADASTGGGGDSCDEGFHCVVEMDCTCVLSFCEADCDPEDPRTCEPGKTCDPNTGVCA